MMIVKQNKDCFHIFDVLGNMGIWEMDIKGLERYFAALENKRALARGGVRAFPFLAGPDGRERGDTSACCGDGDHKGEGIVREMGLPESCFFDTRIVLDTARESGPGIITPPSVSLDVNAVCNYACRWCCTDVHAHLKGSLLALRDIEKKVVRPVAQRGNLAWYLVGGEPALTPRRTTTIASLIRDLTAEYSVHAPLIALDSNGTAFERNAVLFKESGINTVQFSLSSADKEKDRYLRGCPAEADSVRTVTGAIRAAKSLGLHCGINMVLWKERKGRHNLDDVEELIGLGTGLGVDFIRVTPAVCTGASVRGGLNLEIADLKHIAQKLKSYASASGVTRVVSSLLSTEGATDRPMMCRGGTCFMHVDHTGDIYPCAMVMPDFRVGNVVQNDLPALWYGAESFASWREVVEVHPECAACGDRDYCVGKCPAYAWFKFGDPTLSTVQTGRSCK